MRIRATSVFPASMNEEVLSHVRDYLCRRQTIPGFQG